MAGARARPCRHSRRAGRAGAPRTSAHRLRQPAGRRAVPPGLPLGEVGPPSSTHLIPWCWPLRRRRNAKYRRRPISPTLAPTAVCPATRRQRPASSAGPPRFFWDATGPSTGDLQHAAPPGRRSSNRHRHRHQHHRPGCQRHVFPVPSTSTRAHLPRPLNSSPRPPPPRGGRALTARAGGRRRGSGRPKEQGRGRGGPRRSSSRPRGSGGARVALVGSASPALALGDPHGVEVAAIERYVCGDGTVTWHHGPTDVSCSHRLRSADCGLEFIRNIDCSSPPHTLPTVTWFTLLRRFGTWGSRPRRGESGVNHVDFVGEWVGERLGLLQSCRRSR